MLHTDDRNIAALAAAGEREAGPFAVALAGLVAWRWRWAWAASPSHRCCR